MTNNRWQWLAGLAAAAMLAGCSETQGGTGSIQAALVTTGADGATYRLPDDSYLALWGGPGFYDEFSLDGPGSVLTINVPAGDYEAWLGNYVGGYATAWPLERTNPDSTVETVMATLVTPNPTGISVIAEVTTNLVYTFIVPDIGPVTFDTGSVNVSFEVDGAEASSVTFETYADTTAQYNAFTDSAPPSLAGDMPALGEFVAVGWNVQVTGGWHLRSSQMTCAPAITAGTGWSHPGHGDALNEALHHLTYYHEICISTPEQGNRMSLSGYGVGTPTTPTFAPYGTDMQFGNSIVTYLPVAVFDGTSLNLGPLVGSHSLSNFEHWQFLQGVDGGEWEFWHEGYYASDVGFLTFSGQP
jgi:hypothetical protein